MGYIVKRRVQKFRRNLKDIIKLFGMVHFCSQDYFGKPRKKITLVVPSRRKGKKAKKSQYLSLFLVVIYM